MTQKNLCLYFQIHQPTRLRLYRFFDIGKDSHYYDTSPTGPFSGEWLTCAIFR